MIIKVNVSFIFLLCWVASPAWCLQDPHSTGQEQFIPGMGLPSDTVREHLIETSEKSYKYIDGVSYSYGSDFATPRTFNGKQPPLNVERTMGHMYVQHRRTSNTEKPPNVQFRWLRCTGVFTSTTTFMVPAHCFLDLRKRYGAETPDSRDEWFNHIRKNTNLRELLMFIRPSYDLTYDKVNPVLNVDSYFYEPSTVHIHKSYDPRTGVADIAIVRFEQGAVEPGADVYGKILPARFPDKEGGPNLNLIYKPQTGLYHSSYDFVRARKTGYRFKYGIPQELRVKRIQFLGICSKKIERSKKYPKYFLTGPRASSGSAKVAKAIWYRKLEQRFFCIVPDGTNTECPSMGGPLYKKLPDGNIQILGMQTFTNNALYNENANCKDKGRGAISVYTNMALYKKDIEQYHRDVNDWRSSGVWGSYMYGYYPLEENEGWCGRYWCSSTTKRPIW